MKISQIFNIRLLKYHADLAYRRMMYHRTRNNDIWVIHDIQLNLIKQQMKHVKEKWRDISNNTEKFKSVKSSEFVNANTLVSRAEDTVNGTREPKVQS